MVSRRQTVRRPVATGVRRQTTWSQDEIQQTLNPAAGLVLSDISAQQIQENSEETGTCMRLLMEVEISNVATEASPENVSFGIGVLVAPLEVIPANAVPNPCGPSDQDWYYWWCGHRQVSVRGLSWSVDIRSARKLRGNYRLVLVMSNLINELFTTVNITHRTLWKMP